ncbi:MAG: TylF/MycF/NovP-related O-methyltransferase [Candidatus Planktophila sp.]
MKIFLFKLFDRTFGVIFRGIQKTLKVKNAPVGLHHLVNQMAIQDSAEYAVSNFSEALIFRNRENLWDYCIKRIPSLQIEGGIITEFGVWKGESINYFAKKCPKTQVYGFDSFEGLEEDWYGFVLPKGTFNTNGKLPKCEKNVDLYKGWFENTLPSFIKKLDQSKIQILHMDADTYKPTTFVLHSLSKNLGPGTIVIFDEYFGYPNFRSHEFKAWNEFVNSTQIRFRYIGYTEQQVAVEIL